MPQGATPVSFKAGHRVGRPAGVGLAVLFRSSLQGVGPWRAQVVPLCKLQLVPKALYFRLLEK